MSCIALAGNPNAGKSTIFNALTGSHQHVGNWPGKTVEKKEGRLRAADQQQITLVDLPGTYSLNAFSIEELIARDYIVDGKPDAVVCVLDASNLERNLYLVTQLFDIPVPLVIALNMGDVAEKRGITIDYEQLSTRLGGVPVIPTIGVWEKGIKQLTEAMLTATQNSADSPVQMDLGTTLETEIAQLQAIIEQDTILCQYPARWLAINLLENDQQLHKRINQNHVLVEAVATSIQRITEASGEEPDTLIADARYSFIMEVTRDTLTRRPRTTATFSDKLDCIFTHRLLGIPIFLAMMAIVFQVTSIVSVPFQDFIDGVVNGPLIRWTAAIMGLFSLRGTWVDALLMQGIIPGIGGVLVFVPPLFALFLAIAILEDSGYMARAAFVMDRLMSHLGLHGKSFLPLLVGFGCNVPAIYATRTLENEHDRKITGFLIPFMSCSARLPVYVLFGSAFFGAASGSLMFAMYIIGIVVAVLTSLFLTKMVYRNKAIPTFVMELPPYRLPNLKLLLRSIRERGLAFLHKAGIIISTTSLVVWLLLAIPMRPGVGGFNEVTPKDSVFGTISSIISPLFIPSGFGTWQASGALVTGIMAKEVVVSTMNQIYVGEERGKPANVSATPQPSFVDDLGFIALSFGKATVLTIQEVLNIIPRTINLLPGVNIPEFAFFGADTSGSNTSTALQSVLTTVFSSLSAVSFCTFVLLYVPCIATVTALRQEYNSRWMIMQVFYALGVAWIFATLVYQIGRLLGLGG
jgi:ferrous iron transport protein B